jgi:hypothetical protein
VRENSLIGPAVFVDDTELSPTARAGNHLLVIAGGVIACGCLTALSALAAFGFVTGLAKLIR